MLDTLVVDESGETGSPASSDLASNARQLRDDPRTRDALYHHTFVYEDSRLVWVEVPRTASTSVKTGLLGLLGTGADELPGERPFADAHLVHYRDRYPTPSLADLDEDQFTEVLTSPDWLRFCVVRSPFARLFSAFTSMVLLGNPATFGRFGPPDRFDVRVRGRLDVRATFGAFVHDLEQRPDFYFDDMHFRPQADVTHQGRLPAVRVVQLQDLADFWTELNAHVHRARPELVVPLPALNASWPSRTLGLRWQTSYDADSLERVARLYADDLARFGFEVPVLTGQDRLLGPGATAYLDEAREDVEAQATGRPPRYERRSLFPRRLHTGSAEPL